MVKSFSDKENLGKKIKLLQQKREWANVAELKEQSEVSCLFLELDRSEAKKNFLT